MFPLTYRLRIPGSSIARHIKHCTWLLRILTVLCQRCYDLWSSFLVLSDQSSVAPLTDGGGHEQRIVQTKLGRYLVAGGGQTVVRLGIPWHPALHGGSDTG